MKAKLIIDGKETEIEISDEEAKVLMGKKPKQKTGYERVEQGKIYFSRASDGKATDYIEVGDYYDDSLYATANYYSDKTVAENNARADKLYRQLRRFAVEHREKELDWKEKKKQKFTIGFGHEAGEFYIRGAFSLQLFGGIYFDSAETAQLAIDTFEGELRWYFTEYKDSL